jgi:hypothetical protein
MNGTTRNRRLKALLCALALCVFGGLGGLMLPVDRAPETEVDAVASWNALWGDAAASVGGATWDAMAPECEAQTRDPYDESPEDEQCCAFTDPHGHIMIKCHGCGTGAGGGCAAPAGCTCEDYCDSGGLRYVCCPITNSSEWSCTVYNCG